MEATAIVDALYSRIVIIPGGNDVKGRPIILIDAELTTRFANDHLDKVLKYFSSIFSAETRRLGLCIIINAQNTTLRITRSILSSVTEVFKTESTTIIILRPEVFWDKQKVQNCTKLKQWSGPIYTPISRLHKYVVLSDLPEELGGSWVYNHKLWIENRIRVEGFVKLSENVIINLESIRHKLNTSKESLECKITDDVCFVSVETYELAKEEAEKTINAGYALIEQLKRRHTDERIYLRTTPRDIVDTKDRIEGLLNIIRCKVTLMEESWINVQKQSADMKEMMMLEDGVCKVTNWILGPGETLLNAQQNVGYDVVSAEDLRRNHETLELQCRMPYGHYAEILHKLDVLAKNGMEFPQDLKSQKDFMDFVCRSFATRVERRRNVLITSARFFRLVSEYFQITSSVYENLIMRVDIEALQCAEETLDELLKRLTSIDALEKKLVKEGEKLSDLLLIPAKDALGRELAVNYQKDIVNVREILEMTIARRQLFKDSVDLQKLTLQQIIHVHNYEKNSSQAIEWLDELFNVMLKSHLHVGCSVYEIQVQKEQHQCFQETAKGIFGFGCQLLQAALVLRQSCKLSESLNTELTRSISNIWQKLYYVSQEQLTRLRVSAVFHRNVEQYCQQLKELTQNFIVTVIEEDTPEKQYRLKHSLRARENILTEIGRMVRLGRMLKTRLREPVCANNEVMKRSDNEIAIIAITEKLSEITMLAEQLDTTICGFKLSVESESIEKLLDTTDNDYQNSFDKHDKNVTNSSESGFKSDSNKSDEDFVTASECTGTPPSRTSSYHTVSEGDVPSPWWDVDPSISSENEAEFNKVKILPERTPEDMSSEIENEKNERSSVGGRSDLKQKLFPKNHEPYLESDRWFCFVDLHRPMKQLNFQYQSGGVMNQKLQQESQTLTFEHEELFDLEEKSKTVKHDAQVFNNLAQLHIENSKSISNGFNYEKPFMKRAITGIF